MVMQTGPTQASHEGGFTLIEMMISIALLMIVSGTVMKGVLDMTTVNEVITNRTDMHNGVRNATELLTQEVGQAGRITVPETTVLSAASVFNATALTVNSTNQLFVNEQVVVDTGNTEETTTVTAINGNVLTVGALDYAHAAGARVRAAGGFATGVVPDTVTNGSSGTRLKIYGDINGDGSMVYVEYWCDINGDTGVGRLYRNSMPFTQVGKPAPTVEQILIDNIATNPDNTPCFSYQKQTVSGVTYVTDVAITLTVQTNKVDPITKRVQTETKALLNVAPRNVFNVWQLASLGFTNRVQPMPASVQALLP